MPELHYTFDKNIYRKTYASWGDDLSTDARAILEREDTRLTVEDIETLEAHGVECIDELDIEYPEIDDQELLNWGETAYDRRNDLRY